MRHDPSGIDHHVSQCLLECLLCLMRRKLVEAIEIVLLFLGMGTGIFYGLLMFKLSFLLCLNTNTAPKFYVSVLYRWC